MRIFLEYSDESGKPTGYRDVGVDDRIQADPVLQAIGGTAEIRFDPEPLHLFEGGISVTAPEDDSDTWWVDALIEFPEFTAEASWFAFNITIDLVEKNRSRIAAATGFDLSGARPLSTADPTKGIWEWLNLGDPSFTLRLPTARETTFGDVYRIVEGVTSIASEIAAQVRGLSAGVRSAPRPVYRNTRRRVFLCHSSRDKPFVRKLAGELRTHGVDVWVDEEKILVGHDFTTKLEEGLQQSDFIVVVLSPNFVEHGPWAQEEFRTALSRQVSDNKTRILPVLRKDCDIPPLLKAKHYADFRGRFETGLARLIMSIERHET